MKGVILAGGTGSRLNPITTVVNKNVLPVYNKPAIFYSIELLKNAGIEDICIVSEYKFNEDFRTLLGNGSDFGVHISFENDSPLKKGPASALYHAKRFAHKGPIVVVFADGIYDFDLSKHLHLFKNGAHTFLKQDQL